MASKHFNIMIYSQFLSVLDFATYSGFCKDSSPIVHRV